MINKVILVGNVGCDPEIRTLPSGGRVVNFSLATSEYWKDKEKDGARRERTEWHKIVSFVEHLVNLSEKYIKKGSKIYVEGSIRTRKYVDNSGTERYVTEVVVQGFGDTIKLLDGRNSREYDQSNSNDVGNSYVAKSNEVKSVSNHNEIDDDIDDKMPF